MAIYRGRCAYLKDDHTNGKVSIFASGRMISIGSKSYEEARHDLNYAARKLAKLGLISRTGRIQTELRNIVAIADIGQSIRFEEILSQIPHFIYEPEQFPAAICTVEELEGASILLFNSGKIVFAGLKRMELIETAKHLLDDWLTLLAEVPQA
jgi:TATA-box binding protein (TBP) (component of TFIID and TFIIIB)